MAELFSDDRVRIRVDVTLEYEGARKYYVTTPGGPLPTDAECVAIDIAAFHEGQFPLEDLVSLGEVIDVTFSVT